MESVPQWRAPISGQRLSGLVASCWNISSANKLEQQEVIINESFEQPKESHCFFKITTRCTREEEEEEVVGGVGVGVGGKTRDEEMKTMHTKIEETHTHAIIDLLPPDHLVAGVSSEAHEPYPKVKPKSMWRMKHTWQGKCKEP